LPQALIHLEMETPLISKEAVLFVGYRAISEIWGISGIGHFAELLRVLEKAGATAMEGRRDQTATARRCIPAPI
jgi:hypothetical protein